MESKLRLEVIAVQSVSVPTTHETSGAFHSVAKLFPQRFQHAGHCSQSATGVLAAQLFQQK